MPRNAKRKVIPLLLMGVGVFLLIQLVMPAVIYQVWSVTSLNTNSFLIDPTTTEGGVLGISIQNDGSFPAIVSTNSRIDLPYQDFKLAIPSIKLPFTKVTVNSNDLDHSLSQLPGTALPGERGNVFVSGHSSLQQFYSPTNFQAIFSFLPNVKKGDSIFVEAVGQQYEYVVQGLKVVSPNDVSVVNPPDEEGRYLTLMTCVPPGLNIKRLIVLAKLKQG